MNDAPDNWAGTGRPERWSEDANVVVQAFGKSPYRNLEALRDALWDEIHKHTDMVSLAETLGVLEIVKHELLRSAEEK